MNFNTNVNKEVVDSILESALWSKAKITVKSRMDESSANEGEVGAVAEYESGVANTYEEPTTIEAPEEEEEEVTNFTLDDLQYVLDNLEEDDLMEHAMSMLDVFDVAHEQLAEEEDEEEEDEEEEEEAVEEEDELGEESKAEKLEKHLGARGMKTPKGGKGLHSRIEQQKRGERQASTGGAPTKGTRSSS